MTSVSARSLARSIYGRPWVPLIVAISSWSLAPLLAYRAGGLASSPLVAMYTVSLAGLASAALIWARPGFSWLRPGATFRTLRSSGLLPSAALYGIGAFFVYQLLYFSAIQQGPPALANLVNYLWPIVGLSLVAIFNPAARRIEVGMAVVFGFSGAAAAILSGGTIGNGDASNNNAFIAAGAAALTYGGVSAFNSLRQHGTGRTRIQFFFGAFWIGAAICAIAIIGVSLADQSLAAPDFSLQRIVSISIYAALMPLAHFSWLSAVSDAPEASFVSAFVVPVASTGLLVLFVSGSATPELLAALALVLAGIAFANAEEDGTSVIFAILLSFLASIQISQIIEDSGLEIRDIGQGSLLIQLLVELVAIAGGFILANSIQRYNQLRSAISSFHAAAFKLRLDGGDVQRDVDDLRAKVLSAEPDGSPSPAERTNALVDEWAEVDSVFENRVSSYEWMVLACGSVGSLVGFHLVDATSATATLILMRAAAVAVIVGILFTIRDYDRGRPGVMLATLRRQRTQYGFAGAGDVTVSPASSTSLRRRRILRIAAFVVITAMAIVSAVLN